MTQKHSSKGRQAPAAPRPPAPPAGGSKSLLLAIGAVVVVGLGVLAFWHGRGTSADASTAAAAQTDQAKKPSIADVHPTPAAEAAAAAAAALGPHRQESYPRIPFAAYAPPRPPEVVTAAFHFAAEHPEIASYVPCFCGCQQGGHRGNADCFVRRRGANGDVVEWEEHGVECAVCIDVATRSRQMYNSGASARDIRAAIEREFVPNASTMTPTPKPPAN
jgi:Protein of unknown function with PCYCGC motif